jgi:hypothetical protein
MRDTAPWVKRQLHAELERGERLGTEPFRLPRGAQRELQTRNEAARVPAAEQAVAHGREEVVASRRAV